MKQLPEQDLQHILNHTKDLWQDFAGKTLFLTGGTGFFGKWLTESFLFINQQRNLNARLIILSRNPETFLSNHPHISAHHAVTFIKGDIADFAFPDEPLHFIVHAATEASVPAMQQTPLAMVKTIVSGTERVLELALQKNVSAILHTSSGAVYGPQPEALTHLPETYNGAPDLYHYSACYGEGKRMAEMLCNIYYNKYGIVSKIARCFAFLGPHLPLNGHFAAGNFIDNLLKKEHINISGDGTPRRSYLYAADLVVWLWTILAKGAPCRPYNVGAEEAISLKELADFVASKSGGLKVVVQKQYNGEPVQQYVPSAARARQELGLEAHIGWQEAITKTIAFYKN